MWVSDSGDIKIYAYNMATKARDEAKDFNTLAAAGHNTPYGLWSDGTTMWVLYTSYKAFAYDMGTKARDQDKEFSLHVRANVFPDGGLWGDETTLFAADSGEVYAYWLSNGARNAARDISLSEGNDFARGIWSDGDTIWVSDSGDDKIYAYDLPAPVLPEDTLSLERVTDTRALVKIDIRALVRQFGSGDPVVSISVLGSLSRASMNVHPDGGYARFLLMGLRPETQYTVKGRYGDSRRNNLGGLVFRTDYAQLAGMEASGLTHNDATVTVTLEGADLDRRCCFNWYPHHNKDGADPGYTYYLRHKPSDDTVWSDPVELTFSDFTAEETLTGLDPGTAYDVEVGESPTFMPPQGALASYNGTLTVDTDESQSGIGFDQDGFDVFSPPYGSLASTTFELGGVDYSIVELRVGISSFLAPPGDAGKLFLTFDQALPDGAVFTLTLGTAEFSSSDATVRDSDKTYVWAGGPSWSNDDSVAVELDFTGAIPFREGTTLEEPGAFTTPPLPTPFTWETEMTVGTDVNTAGYDSTQGNLSSTTFEVGGVQYTVNAVLYQSLGSLTGFQLEVNPAIPFDFNLTLDATQLKSGRATTPNIIVGGTTLYLWAGTTDPNWASGATVEVELEVFEIIDICSRSPAVAHAIVEATPSFDSCRMVSPIDLAGITRLDLPNGRGTGLKAGDFAGLSGLETLDLSGYVLSGHGSNQLPVGIFDGLDSLTHLDISDTHLLNLSKDIFDGLSNLTELDLSDTLLGRDSVPVGVFDPLDSLEVLRIANAGYRKRGVNLLDGDIFRRLVNLRVLDVRPSKPHLAAPLSLMPLTSLRTYNGADYTRPANPPKNLTASMEDFNSDGSRKKVTLTWAAPDGVTGITGYRVLYTDTGHCHCSGSIGQ